MRQGKGEKKLKNKRRREGMLTGKEKDEREKKREDENRAMGR